MKTIIHDLNEKDITKIKFNEDDKLIYAPNCNKSCIGCFSCWIKHPKRCAIKDDFSDLTEYLKNSTELVLISKCRYGCYSNEVKRVLERCIGYVLPYFCIRNNEIHHKSRYNEKLKLVTYFYGDIDEQDKKSLYNLVKANCINLNAKEYEIKCFNNIEEIIKCIH